MPSRLHPPQVVQELVTARHVVPLQVSAPDETGTATGRLFSSPPGEGVETWEVTELSRSHGQATLGLTHPGCVLNHRALDHSRERTANQGHPTPSQSRMDPAASSQTSKAGYSRHLQTVTPKGR